MKRNQFMVGNIRYTVTRSSRTKTSAIIVNMNGVEVKTPFTKRDSEIKQMILMKKEWILRKQNNFKNTEVNPVPIATKRSPKDLERRAWRVASKIGIAPKEVKVKKMKSRWGSCTMNDVINLNTMLTRTPTKVMDYVIIHELCHLKIRQHSKQYWNLVSEFMSDYDVQKRWLDTYQKFVLYE